MTDLEQALSRFLTQAAAEVDVRAELSDVIGADAHDATRESGAAAHGGSRTDHRRRRLFTSVAAAAAVILLCIGLVLVGPGNDRSPTVNAPNVPMPQAPTTIAPLPSDEPSTTSVESVTGTSPPAIGLPDNGVIVGMSSTATGLRSSQFDPSGAGRIVTLPRELDPAAPADSVWSRDGRRIAFARSGYLMIQEIATGQQHVAATCPSLEACETISWSPDGRSIAVSDGFSIVLVDPDGPADLEETPVATFTEPTRIVDWSHDGRSIVVVQTLPIDDSEEAWLDHVTISSIRADGTDRRTIVDAIDAYNSNGVLLAAVSPLDSTVLWIVWAANQDNSQADSGPVQLELWSAAFDGTGQHRVQLLGTCHCMSMWPGVAWSPDGEQYVIEGADGDSTGGWTTEIFTLDGTSTVIPSIGDKLTWLPDLD